MNFCNLCGNKLHFTQPDDDDRERFVCSACGHIHYQNPRLIVGSIPVYEDKILLCKRAIEPRYGFWTLPGGFMENSETTHEGAIRETIEEAGARVDLHELYTMFSLPHIDQVHLFYRATLLDLDFAPGKESLEVRLFKEHEIPWDSLAFTAVENTLKYYFEDRKTGNYSLRCANVRLLENDRRIVETI